MPIPAVTEKPVLQRALRGPTRSLYNITYHSVFRQSGRYLNRSKAVQIQLGQLFLPLIAGCALLYTQGREAVKAKGGDPKHWLKILTEGTLGYLLIDHTKGLFPLYGLSLGAYRAGKQPDKLSQAQELVKTAIVTAMGYAGVQIGTAWSEAADKIDENELRKLLNQHPKLEQSIPRTTPHYQTGKTGGEKPPQALADEAMAGVKTALSTLRKSLNDLQALKGKTPEAIKQLNEDAAKARNDLLTHFDTLHGYDGGSDNSLVKPLEKLLGRHFSARSQMPRVLAGHLDLVSLAVRNTQEGYIHIARRLNPIFGYIIAGSLVGIPLAKRANAWLEKRFPAWKGQPGPQFFSDSSANPAGHPNRHASKNSPLADIIGA